MAAIDNPTNNVTERWSPQVLQVVTDGYNAVREFDVINSISDNDAILAVIAKHPECNGNEPHPFNPFLRSTGRIVSRPHLNVRRITIPYRTTAAGWWPDPGNPTADPVRYFWEPILFGEAVDRTTAGDLVTNAAGEPLDGAVQGEFQAVRIRAIRNEWVFNAAAALDFGNSVCNDVVSYKNGQWAVQKGQSKVCTISPVSEITIKSPFVQVCYVIDLKPGFVQDGDGYWDAFKARVKNQGRRGWYNASGTPTRGNIVEIVGGQVQPVGHDVLLDATGKPLQTEYRIGTPTGTLAAPIANPNTLPSSIQIETTAYATFLKYFPQGIKLRDHRLLNL